MPTSVELQVFPGLPNPRWVLSRRDEAQFQRLLLALTPSPRPIDVTTVRELPPVAASGYHGTRVRLLNETNGQTQDFHLFRTVVVSGDLSLVDSDRHAERWLFDHAPAHVRELIHLSFDELVAEGLTTQLIDGIEALLDAPACADAPSFPNPLKGSVWDEYRDYNNCYNYALNLPCHNWASPGGDTSASNSCDQLAKLLERDGVRHLSNGFEETCSSGAHFLVLCLMEPFNGLGSFHFFRLDREGWSHKFGADHVRNVDHLNKPMLDLRAARFVTRMSLCGAFEYDNTGSCSVTLY